MPPWGRAGRLGTIARTIRRRTSPRGGPRPPSLLFSRCFAIQQACRFRYGFFLRTSLTCSAKHSTYEADDKNVRRSLSVMKCRGLNFSHLSINMLFLFPKCGALNKNMALRKEADLPLDCIKQQAPSITFCLQQLTVCLADNSCAVV